jgi:hypothetical protein
MTGCGHCDNAHKDLQGEIKTGALNTVVCAGPGATTDPKELEQCSKFAGFPTFTDASGSVCQVGYGGNKNDVLNKCHIK